MNDAGAPLSLLQQDQIDAKAVRYRMQRSVDALSDVLASGAPVYGVTRGFGPLAEFNVDDRDRQGVGLIAHLSVGQGTDLDVETTRLMLELRLHGMTFGYSGIDPDRWIELADLLRAGFVPVVPAVGSVSASGDLIPLAHAADAMAGNGLAWDTRADPVVKVPAAELLARLGLNPIQWQAREALAFVNGTSASLAATIRNQERLRNQCWSIAALTGLAVELLGATSEPYNEIVARARGGSPGHAKAAGWIRDHMTTRHDASSARRLQENYSMRCAPQVIGAVLDFADAIGNMLEREVEGCSDNPIVSAEGVFHAGNFYAITSGLASDQHATLVHQLAFLAERQFASILNPTTNGQLSPLLAPRPGETSGLAGVQLATSAMLAEIRQSSYPATTTPVPTNLDNQDVVPMALMSALRVARQLETSSLILGSFALGLAHLSHTLGRRPTNSPTWFVEILDVSPPMTHDRPFAAEVRAVTRILDDAAMRVSEVTPAARA